MADITCQSAVGAGGCRFAWSLDFDDVANTIIIDATHATFAGDPAPDPQQADITVVLNSSVNATVSCLTGKFVAPSPANLIGQDFSQTDPGPMLNTGPKTRTGVTLKVSANRAQTFSYSTHYTPPA